MSYIPTEAEIKALRRRTGEYPAANSEFSDEELIKVLIDRNGDVHLSAYDVWTWKAAAAAALIDWSADGGDYKQAELYDRYKASALDEWNQANDGCGMIIDPTLKPVEEA